MPFEVIDTQEKFDIAIQPRLERERRSIESKYADYEPMKTKITDLEQKLANANQKNVETEKQLKDLQNEVSGYKLEALKTKVANETGIPFALRDRLQGSTEEEIRKDAETLAGLIGKPAEGTKKPPAPAPRLNDDAGKSPDPLMEMVKNIDFGGI